MGKRKRQDAAGATLVASSTAPSNKKSKATTIPNKNTAAATNGNASSETIQVIAGSYDRILHGITARIQGSSVEFADTFLFNAHSSAIRCVAVSPPTTSKASSSNGASQSQKVLLASGSSDERINLYNLSAHPPSRKNQGMLATVAPRPILENPNNREIGTLMHHACAITALHFPTRSKLLSSAEDSTIAITRTRDWSMLSSIKAPIPKAQGRPSGDTAAFGATPSGVNDFAVHPSMKLMISVSKGEKCMRLWNLVTGKKAGVLNFSREMLQEAGEGKHSTGEGRRVVWGAVDGADEFAVGFERDIVVFGMDSVPKCRVMADRRTKVHHFSYVTLEEARTETAGNTTVLAVATEDGRIVFLSTSEADLAQPPVPQPTRGTSKAESAAKTTLKDSASPALKVAKQIAFVGGREAGVTGRIKDFVVIKSETSPTIVFIVGGSSNGKIRVWKVSTDELKAGNTATKKKCQGDEEEKVKKQAPTGTLLGSFDTNNRITCMAAYLMIPLPDGVEENEEELDEEEEGAQDDGDEDDEDGE